MGLRPRPSNSSTKFLIQVVLPLPGPPVITEKGFSKAPRIAILCSSVGLCLVSSLFTIVHTGGVMSYPMVF